MLQSYKQNNILSSDAQQNLLHEGRIMPLWGEGRTVVLCCVSDDTEKLKFLVIGYALKLLVKTPSKLTVHFILLCLICEILSFYCSTVEIFCFSGFWCLMCYKAYFM